MLYFVNSKTTNPPSIEEGDHLTELIKQDQVCDSDCAVVAPTPPLLLSRFNSNEQGRSFFISSEAKSHLIIEEIPDGFLPTSLPPPPTFSPPSSVFSCLFAFTYMPFIHVTMAIIWCTIHACPTFYRLHVLLSLLPTLYLTLYISNVKCMHAPP